LQSDDARVEWGNLILSIQHLSKLLRAAAPDSLAYSRADSERIGGEKAGGGDFDLRSEKLIVNGQGEFAVGGPEGDNGRSGKKLIIDHYGACRQKSAQGAQVRRAASHSPLLHTLLPSFL
jgi:S-adenosylmethionine synthetase